MAQGYLKVELKTAQNALPVGQTEITVLDNEGNIIFDEFIDENFIGSSSIITLEAPEKESSLSPDYEGVPYSVYNLIVSNELYFDVNINGIQIFAEETAIQPVVLAPVPAGSTFTVLEFNIPPHQLLGSRELPGGTYQRPPQDSGITPNILGEVYIPSTITVHLGRPDRDADNVTVSFKDYIKNVASSEIYPTWPENSLRANILAQISLVLNRVYTEWYRGRGYPFDITNSTAFDQYFIFGRNIFESVSRITDEIFNVYLRKPGRVEPYYAEYCNGTTVTCPGMSQWGTVSLANQGYSPLSILEYYYGELNLITTNDIRGVTGSYPGYPIARGSSGENVRTIQNQLNRIAINYPSISYVFPDGVFGSGTEQAVKRFQEIFDLSPDGVVGKSTWYQLSYIYVAVTKLAELTSEGQRPLYNDFEYPGRVLKRGTVGTDVQELQFYLKNLALFYPTIPEISIDGRYGQGTENAVRGFQNTFDLSPDGEVGEITWEAVTTAYKAILDNVEVPKETPALREYPGYLIRRGSQGNDVLYIQDLLNEVGEVFGLISPIAEDGVFGGATYNAVTAFQRIFGLTQDGIVGRDTWNKLNYIYSVVASGCIYNNSASSSVQPYPGYIISQGSQGANVSYIQRSLKGIRNVIAPIPFLNVDGVFGSGTANAVRTFQSVFGLSADGAVGRDTWSLLNYIYSAVSSGCLSQYNGTF